MHFLLLAIFVFFGLFACSPSTPNKDLILVHYDSGQVTFAEFSDHLAQTPGLLPANMGKAQARERLKHELGELFQIKRLVNQDELLFLKTNPDFQKHLQRSTQQMLADAYLNQVMPSFEVATHEIEAFLVANSPEATPERRSLQNIFLRFPDGADKRAKTAVKKLAQDLRDQINAGASFSQLAREYSDSTTASRGGTFGYASRSDLREPLADAVFSLQVGELSDVLVAENGCHLFFLKHITGDSQDVLQKRRLDAKRQLLNEKKQAWATQHLQECLAKSNRSLPHWPREAAGNNGIIFSLNDQRITEPDMMQAAPHGDLRETFVMRAGELVFSDQLERLDPELAEKTRIHTEKIQAYLYLRRAALLAQIKNLPKQKLYDHYLENQERFTTPEMLAIRWYGFAVDRANPDASLARAHTFTAQLRTSGEAENTPDLSERIDTMSRRDFRFAHKELEPHLPATLSQGMVLSPFQLGELILVLHLVEYQAAQIVAYDKLLDQVPLDFFRVHAKALETAWMNQTQQKHQYQLQEKAFARFVDSWRKES